jgi:preprotein translocase subunit Sec61beta
MDRPTPEDEEAEKIIKLTYVLYVAAAMLAVLVLAGST